MSNLQIVQLTPDGLQPIHLDAETLDQATRLLPGGLYTTFRTYAEGTRVLGLQDHLNRLYVPAAEQNITPSVDEGRLRELLASLCETAKPAETRVRLSLSVTGLPGACFAVTQPYVPPPADVYERGVKVISEPMHRKTPRLKTTSFISSSAEARQHIAGEIYEALLVRPDPDCPECPGCVLEGMTSNFYALQGQTLITARSGILLGVTRHVVIRLARQLGLEIDYRPPCLDEPFDEAFITSSGRGVVPVVEIDGKPLGKGVPGPVAWKLQKMYEAYVVKNAELILPK